MFNYIILLMFAHVLLSVQSETVMICMSMSSNTLNCMLLSFVDGELYVMYTCICIRICESLLSATCMSLQLVTVSVLLISVFVFFNISYSSVCMCTCTCSLLFFCMCQKIMNVQRLNCVLPKHVLCATCIVACMWTIWGCVFNYNGYNNNYVRTCTYV